MKSLKNILHFVLCTLLFSCHSIEKKSIDKIVNVKVQDVLSEKSIDEHFYVGTVEEAASLALAFSQLGTVEQIFVQVGQKVKKGQLLASLNTATAENSYQIAKSKLEQAQDAYDRLVKVRDNGSLPEIKFVEIQTGLQQAKSMADISKKNLDDCKLLAPCDGVISTKNVEPGVSIMPGTQVLKLVSIDKVFVKFPVPEHEIALISEGQKCEILVSALENKKVSGKIEMKGVAANPISHTYEVKMALDNKNENLLPGMACKVRTTLKNTKSNVSTDIVIPNRSLHILADGKHYVWLAIDGRAKKTPVTVGNLAESGIIIKEGLKVGDKLIVDGFHNIYEDCEIVIRSDE